MERNNPTGNSCPWHFPPCAWEGCAGHLPSHRTELWAEQYQKLQVTNYRVSPTSLLPSKPLLCFPTEEAPSSQPRWAPPDLYSHGGPSSPSAPSFAWSHTQGCSIPTCRSSRGVEAVPGEVCRVQILLQQIQGTQPLTPGHLKALSDPKAPQGPVRISLCSVPAPLQRPLSVYSSLSLINTPALLITAAAAQSTLPARLPGLPFPCPQ